MQLGILDNQIYVDKKILLLHAGLDDIENFTIYYIGIHFRFSITPEKAAEGKKYRLYMPFNGRLNDKLQGFYKASYIDLSGHQRLVKFLLSLNFNLNLLTPFQLQ